MEMEMGFSIWSFLPALAIIVGFVVYFIYDMICGEE